MKNQMKSADFPRETDNEGNIYRESDIFAVKYSNTTTQRTSKDYLKRPTAKSVKSIEPEEERSLWSPMFITTIIVTMLGSEKP